METQQGKTILTSIGDLSEDLLQDFDRLMVMSSSGMVFDGHFNDMRQPLQTLLNNSSLGNVAASYSQENDNNSFQDLALPSKKQGCCQTFGKIWARNVRHYSENLRSLILCMAAASIVLQASLLHSLGSQLPPAPSTVMLLALDTFVVVTSL